MDEIVPVSKPSRIADNATVDSRVATIKQRPSSRCFPSATDMNVSGSSDVLRSLLNDWRGSFGSTQGIQQKRIYQHCFIYSFYYLVTLRHGLLCVSSNSFLTEESV